MKFILVWAAHDSVGDVIFSILDIVNSRKRWILRELHPSFIISYGFLEPQLRQLLWSTGIGDKRTCCNLAGFVPTMDLDETSAQII